MNQRFATALFSLIITLYSSARLILAFSIILFFSTSTFALDKRTDLAKPLTEPLKPSFRVYSDRHGLPQSSATAIEFDKRGYLWVGTQDGAAYYNGRKWTVVNMPNRDGNYVRAILSCADGRLFFGTINGLYCLQNDQWQTFTKQNSALPNDSIFSLLETVGADGRATVWVGTDEGLAQITDNHWTIFNTNNSALPSNNIAGMVETITAQGRSLWLGTPVGLVRFSDNRWTTFNTKNSPLSNDNVQCLLASYDNDHQLTLWIGTQAGLSRYSGNRWQTFNSQNSSLPNDNIQTMAESITKSGQHKLWLGTQSGGLICYKDDQWTIFNNTNSSLPANNIIKLMAQRLANGENTLWIGSFSSGLIRLKDDKWALFDTRNSRLPFNFALGMLETRSANNQPVYWIGTDGGLIRYENGQWRTFNTQNSQLQHNGINAILEVTNAQRQRELWLATFGGGLVRIVNDKWTVFTTKNSQLPEDKVQVLLTTRDSDGRAILWVGTFGGGLVKISGDNWQVFNTKNSQLPNNYIFSLAETRESDGRSILWVGTYGDGLLRIDGEQWTKYQADNSRLPGNVVVCIKPVTSANGEKQLWVGTATGACRINLTKPETNWLVLNDQTQPALPNNTINQICQDDQYRVYFFTNKGIACLISRDVDADNYADAYLYNFTTEDGLPSNECDSNGSMIDSRGRIWAGMVGGVAVFQPREFVPDQQLKPLALEQTLINGKGYANAAGSMHNQAHQTNQPLSQLSLSYKENNLSFEYTLLSYFKESETRFRTQLIGYDEKPSEWSTFNKQDYTNLQEGEYKFRIWARDYAGNITSEEIISFHINSAPWRSWWAYFCYCLFGASAIYGGMQLRLRSLKERNEMLEIKIHERTAIIAEQKEDLAKKNEALIHSERRALEANRAKSVFLANMSHELRTPLNAILGFVQLMERDNNRNRPDREKLSIILRSGEHLLGLINDVLSIGKIEAGQITLVNQPFSLLIMLEGLEEMFSHRAQAKHLRFEIVYDPSLPEFVIGDEGRLRQILINLLGNAFKFTEQGAISLRVAYQCERAFFAVQDTGSGIEPAEQNKLFQPFVQTQSGASAKEGTGLGLAISRHLVNLMGGDIALESMPGQGATFSFEVDLPIAQVVAEQIQIRKVVKLVPGQPQYRILIVDDVTENRTFLAELLTTVGFSVRQGANGVEAVDIWQEWQPHLIWMDMRMPLMDGNAATRLIRTKEIEERAEHEQNGTENQRVRTVIIALTASSFEHDRNAILANGCDDFVSKPFRVNTIFEKLAQKLDAKFIFEDSEKTTHNNINSNNNGTKLTPTDLRLLPAVIRADLKNAIINGNVETARTVTEQIKKIDTRTAENLESLINRFQFSEIFALLQEE